MRSELPEERGRAIFLIEGRFMADDQHERSRAGSGGRHSLALTAPRARRRATPVAAAVFGAIALVATLSGCAAHVHHEHVLYVLEAPPPDPVELEGSAPSAAYVWVKGHYDCNGVEYVWIPGDWAPRPAARAVWIAGRWQHTRRGWTWVDGHWS